MSFYFNGLQYVPGGDPGDILFIDPTQPGVVDTDTFFKYDPTTRRVRIWGGIGAGLDIGTGGMRIAYDGLFGLSVGTVGGTSYLQIGSSAPDTDPRARFLNLGVSGASTNALLDITGTWNTTGAANGIRLNVTDTASAAGALLMDLRAGGDSKFKVDKIGNVSVGSATGVGSLAIVPSGGTWPVISRDGGDGGLILGFNSGSASIKLFGTDIAISRDAADTLAQRRGVNAQAFRIYNTFTDASNYERLAIAWSGNVLRISTQAAGTGSVRDIEINSSKDLFFQSGSVYRWAMLSATGHLIAYVDNTYDIGNNSNFRPRNLFLGSYMQMSEMTAPAAPAANSVRIYAEDNGSGKTRLMALFATGAAQQIAIEP